MDIPSLILKIHYNFALHLRLQFIEVNSIPEYPFDIFDINQLENEANLNNLVINISIIV